MLNFPPSLPWYRRFEIGDRWPGKTTRQIFSADVRGASILIERHTRDCTCSYCRGGHGRGLIWLPVDRGPNSWRVLNLFHRVYVRWTHWK